MSDTGRDETRREVLWWSIQSTEEYIASVVVLPPWSAALETLKMHYAALSSRPDELKEFWLYIQAIGKRGRVKVDTIPFGSREVAVLPDEPKMPAFLVEVMCKKEE